MPLMTETNRRIRSMPNPLDKSTIVSIYPKKIHEIKHTIYPGEFDIPSGTRERPGLLTIGSSSWFREMDEGQPDLEIVQSSVQVADSIVRDWAIGILGVSVPDAMPGVFFLPGEFTLVQILKDKAELLDIALARQKNWYQILIEMADNLWARTNGNPRAISGDMKLAAEQMGLKDKPWMANVISYTLKNCPACGTLTNHDYPICANCKYVINKEKAIQLGIEVK